MRVVIQQGTTVDVVVEVTLCLGVERGVEVFFGGMKLDWLDSYEPGWELHVGSAHFLGPLEQCLVKRLVFEEEVLS